MGQEDVKFSNLSVGEKRIILFSQIWNLVIVVWNDFSTLYNDGI